MAQKPDSKCESCGEREASILFTKIHVDEKQTLRLCAVCAAHEAEKSVNGAEVTAQKTAVEGPLSTTEVSGGDAADATFAKDSQKVVEVNVVIGHLAKKKGASRACPRCGMTSERFRKQGRFGCSECYSTFAVELKRVFKRIHGFQKHAGKGPENASLDVARPSSAEGDVAEASATDAHVSVPEQAKDVEELRRSLEQAVRDEDYERAAELRDRIASLEGD